MCEWIEVESIEIKCKAISKLYISVDTFFFVSFDQIETFIVSLDQIETCTVPLDQIGTFILS